MCLGAFKISVHEVSYEIVPLFEFTMTFMLAGKKCVLKFMNEINICYLKHASLCGKVK